MEIRKEPSLNLAKKTLPKELIGAIEYIFEQGIENTVLVGGTALSGFYSAHRKSDDIDLFTKNEESFKACLLAIKSLKNEGYLLENETTSKHYYHANASKNEHYFTIDLVLDKNLFQIGTFKNADRIQLASLDTLLKMKSAALVSRASAKDLSDIMILFSVFPDLNIKDFISYGYEVDGGVNAESMLASLLGASLRLEACAFSYEQNKSSQEVYKEFKDFQKNLSLNLQTYLKKQKAPPLAELVKKAKKVLK